MVVWLFTRINLYWVVHAWDHKFIVRSRNHRKVVTYLRLSISTPSTAIGPLWVTRLLNVLLASGVSVCVYALAFVL